MPDQDAKQNKPLLPGQPSKGENKLRPVGRFGNINLDDELDEAKAGESLSSIHYTDENENNTEDWKEVKKQLDSNPLALTSPITALYETVLHILVNSKQALWLVEEIIDQIDSDSLGKTDHQHDTPLSIAAYVGNAEAAMMMARKSPELLTKINHSNDSPFHAAARFGHEETFSRLLTVAQTTQMDDQSFFSGDNGATMVQYLISSNLYGLALDLLKRYPKLGRENLRQRRRILKELAKKPLGFESGCKFGFWERLIYKGISVTKEVTVPSIQAENDDFLQINIVDRDNKVNPTNSDGEPKMSSIDFFAYCRQQAYSIMVPSVKRIYRTKLMNEQARQLVKSMCAGVVWTFPEASCTLKLPLLKAASLGIQEIVQEILKVYKASTMFYDDNNYNIFQLAVLHRREKVFNLVYKMGLSQKWVASYPCKDNENILHLAGRCASSRHINGAALQMQWEMQWFTAVEKFVHPLLLEERNTEKKTPREVFDDEHKNLVKEGEKWMRDTATSCMVVDALIIAMVFAAIIAVPGNNEKGIPNFRHETLFEVFVIADAAALFSSSASLLLFVRILTSRYAEEDFIKALPKSLLLGLITLIFSIATMLVASSSALIMLIDAVPGPKVMPRKSTVIPVAILVAFPIIFFI
ncbi:PGG domain - like 10 [Theobroma cacao]|nr:PGG domain - like 10 [Theobroma cacao]